MTGTPPTPSVSVVVPTHNRRRGLPALLDALARDPIEEIVVVANGCTDGSLELLEARCRDDPRIMPIFTEIADKPPALQRGVELASGEVVLLLDDDVLPEPGLASGHAAHHRPGTHLLVVGYMPVAAPSPRRPGEFAIDLYSRAYERACEEYEADPASILWGLWGGNISLRREDALRIGLESQTPTMTTQSRHEDREFGLRCAQAGIEAIFDRNLRASHEHRATLEGFLRMSRSSGRARWVVHKEYRPTIGPLPDDFFALGVPPRERLLVRLARHRSAHRIVQAGLRAVTKAAGLLHLFKLESHAGWLMGIIEQQRGALDMAASHRAQESPAR